MGCVQGEGDRYVASIFARRMVLLAGLLQVLEESGFKDNTIVIFTSDHGDMLGERGMWFKMSFLEHSARVPLIIHAPARYSPRRVGAAVSLVDLLPTWSTWPPTTGVWNMSLP